MDAAPAASEGVRAAGFLVRPPSDRFLPLCRAREEKEQALWRSGGAGARGGRQPVSWRARAGWLRRAGCGGCQRGCRRGGPSPAPSAAPTQRFTPGAHTRVLRAQNIANECSSCREPAAARRRCGSESIRWGVSICLWRSLTSVRHETMSQLLSSDMKIMTLGAWSRLH